MIKNKRAINPVILAILTIVLGVVVYLQYFSGTPPPEGALRVVKCSGCGNKSVNQIKDINDRNDPRCICAKCRKPLGYAFKCDDCDFEFSVIPIDKPPAGEMAKMKTMGKFTYVLQMRKCPNCGSTRTTPVSVESK
jgi:predicted RNA-binding Zn-ribbon protein involved in translation (DUF1610 family)